MNKLITITFEDGWTFKTKERVLIDIYLELEQYDLHRATKIDLAGVVYAITLEKPLMSNYVKLEELVYEVAALDRYKDQQGLTDKQKLDCYNELMEFLYIIY